MPDFGIVEGLGALFGGGDLLGGLFGGLFGAGEAAGAGAGALGAGVGADVAATGLGLAGEAGAFGAGADVAASGLGAAAGGAATAAPVATEALGAATTALPSIEGAIAPAASAATGGQAATDLASLGITGSLPDLTGNSVVGSITAGPAAAAGDVGGAAAGAGAAPGGGILGSIGKSVAANPLGVGLAATGLGLNLARGANVPGADVLKQQADQLAAQGGQLQSYITSGKLPPGLQGAVQQAAQAAKARIVSNHASRGLPTDPKQNSALAQELSAVDQNIPITTANIAQNLLQSGISESGLAANIYQALIRIDQTQNAQVGQAISNFAGALGGGTRINAGGKSITIN